MKICIIHTTCIITPHFSEGSVQVKIITANYTILIQQLVAVSVQLQLLGQIAVQHGSALAFAPEQDPADKRHAYHDKRTHK